MKAIQIKQYGGPEVLELCDLPTPDVGPDDVLIRMKHSGINVMDIKTRNGDYDGSTVYRISLPTTLGMEGAGVIERIGDNVRHLRVGDRVAYCLVWNSYAELALVPSWRVVRVPDALPLEIAGTSTFQGFTAHYLVNDVAALKPGMSCLVHAASGGVGHMLVSLATRLGCTVYGTVRDEGQMQRARDRGLVDVFLSKDGLFADAVREATDGRGVDVVFDSIGAPTLRHDFRAVRRKGLVVNFGSSAGAVKDLDPAELGEAGSVFLTRPRLDDYLQDGETVRRRGEELYRQMVEGDFGIPVGRRYGLNQIRQAHEDVESGEIEGKAGLDFASSGHATR